MLWILLAVLLVVILLFAIIVSARTMYQHKIEDQEADEMDVMGQ